MLGVGIRRGAKYIAPFVLLLLFGSTYPSLAPETPNGHDALAPADVPPAPPTPATALVGARSGTSKTAKKARGTTATLRVASNGCYSPVGIRTDGVGDVTALLQGFVDAVPNGSCISLPRGSRFRLDGTLVLRDRTNLTLDGNGAVLFTNAKGSLGANGRSSRALLHVWKGTGVEVRELVIDGPNSVGTFWAPYEEEAGILLSGPRDTVVRDVTVREVYGDAVSVYGFKPGDGSGRIQAPHNVLITGLDADRIGRQGIAITSADGVTIEESQFNNIARSVFDLEPTPHMLVHDVNIVRNTVKKFELSFLAGLGWGKKDGVYVGYNRSLYQPIWMKFIGDNFTIEGNVGGGTAYRSFVQVNDGDNIRVVGNTQIVHGDGAGKCPPNCGIAGISLGSDKGGTVCDVYAEDNVFKGAKALFFGKTEPEPECEWTDGGGNVL